MPVTTAKGLRRCVLKLLEKHENRYDAPLEEYLRSLLGLFWSHRGDKLSYSLMASLLEQSFSTLPVPFNEAWMAYTDPPEIDELDGYVWTEHVLLFQIADLRRMEDKEMKSPFLYLGVVSPTGNSWYNFDPLTYLECATQGLVSQRTEIPKGWATLGLLLELGRVYE